MINPSTQPVKNPDQNDSGGTSLSDISSGLGAGLGVFADLSKGGTASDLHAATTAGQFASKFGAFGDNSSAIGAGLQEVNEAYSIYTGLQHGGLSGYANAGINAARLGSQLGIFGGASGEIGDIAGMAAIPLSLYNFGKNWKSGATGSDTLSGLSAGASIGSAILPGVGTFVGAGIGAAVGAISSAFGPGKEDQENITWDNYAKTFDQNPQAVNQATPSQNFQSLTGIFDSRGSSIPFYGKYGRMGEAAFTTDMMSQVNQAFTSGKITSADTPQSIYQKVVAPWITSMSTSGWQDANTVEGSPTKAAVGNMLTNMIGQWMQGQLTSQTPVGISGQTLPGLPSFAGGGSIAGSNPGGMSSLPAPHMGHAGVGRFAHAVALN